MAKKRKKKIEKPDPRSYENHPEVHGVISRDNWEFVSKINKQTKGFLETMWANNLKENVESRLWEKHHALVDDCLNLAKNKAVIGIGAGSSFNGNKDVLSYFLRHDGLKNWENRAFVTIASNHQYKPLLEMGIIPDFVLLVDGSDVVYDQLCTDIPKHGNSTVLIAGLHCSPKVLNEWTDQGRSIRFYINMAELVQKRFKELTKQKAEKYQMELGGNVLNGAWAISIARMGSNVFMSVGNDLSYNIDQDIEKQRTGYYADGDYSTNAKITGTGRDEAGTQKRWAGISMKRSLVINPKGLDRYNINLEIVGTSHTLWVYKTWLESTLVRHNDSPRSFHYFNCSEAGILGVMAKDSSDEALKDKNNWYMLDDVCRVYHTAMLKDAMEHFLKCKEIFECPQKLLYAQDAGNLVGLH